MIAKYDDIHENECEIEIGNYIDEKFVSKIRGVSDAIKNEKIGFGGCWIEMTVHSPELTFEIKTK